MRFLAIAIGCVALAVHILRPHREWVECETNADATAIRVLLRRDLRPHND